MLLVVYCSRRKSRGILWTTGMSNTPIVSRFGAAVRSLRGRLGISQEQLAERADLHRTYIAGIEGGRRNVTLKSVAKLADALQVTTSELLATGEPARTPARRLPRPATNGQIVDILMVEDNPDDVELTLAAFRKVRIANRVHVARDGEEALECIFGAGPDAGGQPGHLPQLILLDLMLPKIDGFEVLRRLKRDPRTRRIPVIVLTVSQRGRDVAECRRLGAEAYLVKPVDFYNFSRVTPQLRFQWALYKPSALARA